MKYQISHFILKNIIKSTILKKYTDLDNPTGISVEKGDELIVLVGDTHNQSIYLECIDEETTSSNDDHEYQRPAAHGHTFSLKPGVNKLVMTSSGQLFLIYTADIFSPDAQPIKIHIPLGSGKVTGYTPCHPFGTLDSDLLR